MARRRRTHRNQRSKSNRSVRVNDGEKFDGFDQMKPVWSFSSADRSGTESLFSDRACQDWCVDILPKLRDFETMTWAEIKRQTYSGKKGRRKTNHHYVDTERLPNNAKQRLIHLKLDDHDQLFSLRLNSRIRIYGIVVGHVFRIVWYDSDHRLHPSRAD